MSDTILFSAPNQTSHLNKKSGWQPSWRNVKEKRYLKDTNTGRPTALCRLPDHQRNKPTTGWQTSPPTNRSRTATLPANQSSSLTLNQPNKTAKQPTSLAQPSKWPDWVTQPITLTQPTTQRARPWTLPPTSSISLSQLPTQLSWPSLTWDQALVFFVFFVFCFFASLAREGKK